MEVGGGPERWPWLARFWRGEEPIGAGFLIDAHHLLTCAHVVSAVLGLDQDSQELPSGELTLDFPTFPEQGQLTATVAAEGWYPVQKDQTGDVAVLTLSCPPPAGMTRPVDGAFL